MQDKKISRFPIPKLGELPDDIKNQFISVQEKIGFVPNVFLTLAYRPDEFRAFIATAEQFVSTVSDPGPPNEYANLVTSHEELKTLVNLVYLDTVELLAGLESSDTGEQRAAALDSFNKNLDQFIKKIDEIVASATSS